jgi:O-methyltransferase
MSSSRTLIKTVVNTALRPIGLEVHTHRALHPGLSWEVDVDFAQLFERAHRLTQTPVNQLRRQRHYVLMQLFRWSLATTAAPRVAECGVFRGASLYQLASIIRDRSDGDLYALDTFEGLQEFRAEDGTVHATGEFAASLETVKKGLAEFPRIHYERCRFPATPAALPDAGFTFVHIDMDLYAPIAAAFRLFLPRMASGGILVFDDYGYVRDFPGARLAVDEVCAEARLYPVVLPTGQAFVQVRSR